jgi:hypothetical protein
MLLKLIFCFIFICTYSSAEESNPLIGTWKSNKEKTLKYYSKTPVLSKLTDEQRKMFKGIFGKMVITYSSNTFTWTMDEFTSSGNYKIIANNEDTIITLSEYPLLGEQLTMISFEEDGTYLTIPQGHRYGEFFSKVKKSTNHAIKQMGESTNVK